MLRFRISRQHSSSSCFSLSSYKLTYECHHIPRHWSQNLTDILKVPLPPFLHCTSFPIMLPPSFCSCTIHQVLWVWPAKYVLNPSAQPLPCAGHCSQVIVRRSLSSFPDGLQQPPRPLLPLPLPRALSNFYQQWGWLKSTHGLPFIAPYITSFLFTLYPISPFSFSNIFPILLGAVRCKQKSTVWGFLGGYGFPDKKGWTQPEQSTFCASIFLSVWHTNLYLEKKSSWHQEVESHALNLVER